MPKKIQVKLSKEDKFRQCPACFGPIDYFNSCRKCGRGWTPELTETEKVEQQEGQRPEEEPEPVLVGDREAALGRDKEEILGKKAKVVGTKKKNIPASFKLWEILNDDSDIEVSRKRSLMRLDSRRIYNQMGLAMRAYQNQKGVMLWLTRLWEFLDETEREAFAASADHLKLGLIGLAELSATKIALAAQMEEALQKEQRKLRTVRAAKSAIAAAEKAKRATKVTTPGADSEGLETVDLVELDPEELMEQVRLQLKLNPKKSKKTQIEDEEEEN